MMKEPYSLAFMIAMAVLLVASPTVAQTTVSDQPRSVTLYSPEKHKLTNAPPLSNGKLRPDVSRAYFSFTTGTLSPRQETIVALSGILENWAGAITSKSRWSRLYPNWNMGNRATSQPVLVRKGKAVLPLRFGVLQWILTTSRSFHRRSRRSERPIPLGRKGQNRRQCWPELCPAICT